MRLKVEKAANGLHPNEVVVAIRTSEGVERLVVHLRSIHNESIDVGYPIDKQENVTLVELPRETTTGSWRVWVPNDTLIPERVAEAVHA